MASRMSCLCFSTTGGSRARLARTPSHTMSSQLNFRRRSSCSFTGALSTANHAAIIAHQPLIMGQVSSASQASPLTENLRVRIEQKEEEREHRQHRQPRLDLAPAARGELAERLKHA